MHICLHRWRQLWILPPHTHTHIQPNASFLFENVQFVRLANAHTWQQQLAPTTQSNRMAKQHSNLIFVFSGKGWCKLNEHRTYMYAYICVCMNMCVCVCIYMSVASTSQVAVLLIANAKSGKSNRPNMIWQNEIHMKSNNNREKKTFHAVDIKRLDWI